jgi:outer membrane protein assembly complex protein YaeT
VPRRSILPHALGLAATALLAAGGPLRAQPAPDAAAPPAVVRITRFVVTGSIDPPGRLEAFLADFIPLGTPFVPAGPVDLFGPPISTPGRLQAALARLGYGAQIEPRQSASGLEVAVALRPVDRVRQIFVRGNWPLRQEEITRRLTLRGGQGLEPAGQARDGRLDRERQSVLDYLRAQGYLDAAVTLEPRDDGRVPAQVNLYVRIRLGPGYPLGPVSVTGSQSLTADEVAATFQHHDWRSLWTQRLPFRLPALQADLQVLTARIRALGYPAARVTTDYDPARSVDRERKEVALGVTVDERRRLTTAFTGNRRFTNADLRELLTFEERGAMDNYEVAANASAIERRYRDKGHMFARVKARREALGPDHDRVTFTIDEGPRIRVREVSFVGQQVLRAADLAGVVVTRPFPLLGHIGLGEGGYASLVQLGSDVDRLESFYESMGYPGTRARCEVAPLPERFVPLASVRADDPVWRGAASLYVRFTIAEAPRVDVAALELEGAPGEVLPASEAFLRANILDTRVGAPFRPFTVRADADRLRRLLGDLGHPHATVEVLTPREGNAVTVRFQLELGPRLTVGPMFVRGNFLTRPSTIEQWLRLRPGGPLRTTDFEHSQRNLALIQLFTNASPISFPAEATSGGRVPMLIEIEERHDHFGVVRVGGGASTEQKTPGSDIPVGGYGALAYEHRNLFGRGWSLLSRGELGNSQTRLAADLLEPRLFGTAFRLEVSGSYLQQETVRLGDVRSGGGSLGFVREVYPGLDLAARYGLRRTLHPEPLLRAAGPDAEQSRVDIATVVGTVGLGFDWQRLDNALVPTRGFRIDGGVDLAAPALSLEAGDDTFVKLRARSLAVLPLTSRLGIRHTFRYDQGLPLAGASVLPKVERYYAGGDTTLRGFALDRARQEAIPAEVLPGVVSYAYRPIGGSLRVLHSLDLTFAVTGPLFCGVFLDTGLVADSLDGLRLQRFRYGAGVAPLMLRLPIGDLSFAWAWPLDPQPGDSRNGVLVFNVGLMF